MEQPVIAQCRSDPATCKIPAALKLIAIAEEGAQDERLVRIGRINRAVNLALRWKEGTPWTTPLAALSAGVGDCKHYAVLKYAAFSEAGFAPDDLRLIIVRIKSVRASHMVLAVRDSKRWLILDSRNFGLVDSRELHDYLPLFSLDRHGIRQFEAAPDAKVSDAGCHAIIG